MSMVRDRKTFRKFVENCCNKPGLSASKRKAYSIANDNPLVFNTAYARVYARWRAYRGPITDFWDWLIQNQDEVFAIIEKIIAVVLKVIDLFS